MWPLSIIFGMVKSFLGTALGKYVGLGIGGAVLLGGALCRLPDQQLQPDEGGTPAISPG